MENVEDKDSMSMICNTEKAPEIASAADNNDDCVLDKGVQANMENIPMHQASQQDVEDRHSLYGDDLNLLDTSAVAHRSMPSQNLLAPPPSPTSFNTYRSTKIKHEIFLGETEELNEDNVRKFVAEIIARDPKYYEIIRDNFLDVQPKEIAIDVGEVIWKLYKDRLDELRQQIIAGNLGCIICDTLNSWYATKCKIEYGCEYKPDASGPSQHGANSRTWLPVFITSDKDRYHNSNEDTESKNEILQEPDAPKLTVENPTRIEVNLPAPELTIENATRMEDDFVGADNAVDEDDEKYCDNLNKQTEVKSPNQIPATPSPSPPFIPFQLTEMRHEAFLGETEELNEENVEEIVTEAMASHPEYYDIICDKFHDMQPEEIAIDVGGMVWGQFKDNLNELRQMIIDDELGYHIYNTLKWCYKIKCSDEYECDPDFSGLSEHEAKHGVSLPANQVNQNDGFSDSNKETEDEHETEHDIKDADNWVNNENQDKYYDDLLTYIDKKITDRKPVKQTEVKSPSYNVQAGPSSFVPYFLAEMKHKAFFGATERLNEVNVGEIVAEAMASHPEYYNIICDKFRDMQPEEIAVDIGFVL